MNFLSAVQTSLAPVLGISPLAAGQVVLGLILVAGFVMLFKPLLLGIARALVLVVRPKMSKQQRLALRQMRDAAI